MRPQNETSARSSCHRRSGFPLDFGEWELETELEYVGDFVVLVILDLRSQFVFTMALFRSFPSDDAVRDFIAFAISRFTAIHFDNDSVQGNIAAEIDAGAGSLETDQ